MPDSAAGPRTFAYCPDPVFVIGAPRSGTTALGKSLGHHSRFYAGDETLFLVDLFDAGRAEGVYDRWAGRPSSSWLRRERVTRDDFLAALGLGINALFTAGSDGLRWVDHTPGNALILGTLAGIFPGAKFLHILRDGREVVQSMVNVSRTLTGDQAEQMRQSQFLPDWTRDFRAACETWRSHVRSVEEYRQAHTDRCLVVRHRELEVNPAGTTATVFRFLDEQFEERPAWFLARQRVNSSFMPLGVCRAAEYRRPDPLATWTDDEKIVFAEVCGPEMEALGFA